MCEPLKGTRDTGLSLCLGEEEVVSVRGTLSRRLPIRLLTFRGTHEFLRNHVGTDKCAGITHACPWGRMCMAHALSASKLKLVVGILISLRLYYL